MAPRRNSDSRSRQLRPTLATLLFALAACDEGAVVQLSPAADAGPSPAGAPIDPIGDIAPTSSWDLDLTLLPASAFAVERPAGFEPAWTFAQGLVAQMTPAEKLDLLHGVSGTFVGSIAGVPRLGIPSFALHDGPAGVAGKVTGVTAFPAPLAVAATWDRDLARRFGLAMAEEERAKGISVHLAPMMNMARSPCAGRNFEGFGEEPWLAAELAATTVAGIQSQAVVATAKHFIANEQETARTTSNSEVDERTLHEIYYPPFEAAARAGVGAVMCSYNLVNGLYACENPHAMADLRGTLGFTGWVMSDWNAAHSTVAAANAGLDMEMPGATFFGDALALAVEQGTVAASQLDEMATRIVAALARVGVLDNPPTLAHDANVRSAEHTALAREIATAALTLLKNEGGALPLDPGIARIAVIGDAARQPVVVGGGSAEVVVTSSMSPFDAIGQRAGADVAVMFAGSAETAVQASAEADAAIVFLALPSTEGMDHEIGFPAATDALVSAVADANPRTIVVLETPGAVLMPWVSKVSAILEAWYGGEEMGSALAAVLFGDVSPGGKLPLVFPQSAADLPSIGGLVAKYEEGLFIGQRLLDRDGREPLFAFGHGLSYTSFAYDGLSLGAGDQEHEVRVAFGLTNTGSAVGSEVVELYLGFPEGAGEPALVLRGFERVTLAPGERRDVSMVLGPRSLSLWDLQAHAWVVPSGTFRIGVGSSERAIQLAGTLTVRGTAPGG